MSDALSLFSARFAPPVDSAAGTFAFALPSLTGSSNAFLALTLAQKGTDPTTTTIVLTVTPGIPDADQLADDLRILSAKSPTRIFEFPPLLEGEKSSLGLRLKTLAALRAWSLSPYPAVIVAPYAALATPLPISASPSLVLSTATQTAASRQQSLGEISEKLAKIGYKRLPMVENEGDYSVRGGILDVWSPGDDFPVRAEFFGDDLESLRTFNPSTQISIDRIDSIELMPINGDRPPINGDRPHNPQPPTNNHQPPTNNRLFDLLPAGSTVLAIEHNAYNLWGQTPQPPTTNQQPTTSPGGQTPQPPTTNQQPTTSPGGQTPQPPNQQPTTNNQQPTTSPQALNVVYTGDPAPRGVPTYAFPTAPLPGFAELGADEAHHPELFEAARGRLEQHLAAAERRGAKIFRIDDLSGGFELPLNHQPPTTNQQPTTSLIIVTKADRVFTKKHTHFRTNAAIVQGPRLNDFDDLEPGEYVVHVDYGVGRYLGSSEITVDGRRSEVFTIEYADGGKLHVPAAHAHLLSRYVGVKGETVRMHRLDGKRWAKDKVEAQKAVTDLAAALLSTQAKRETVPGFAYDVAACDGLDAFEAAFPYEETPDQTAAIAAVKADLAARKPMDRLICGDAGYGKTEVAMRAAYVAAMNGKQVAVLAPTTVLAEQHFETFTSRFDGTPVRIESVSRFQSTGTHSGTFRRLATGVCDIVIGTHAILSSKIAFRDLGLIIIDEEQRFGVRHKEYLKTLRATADVLTLSATPIPRTLYLSMTGARDLSLLRSPPRERVAVDTRIVRDDDETIRSAIEGELARGGQVFFLHNRVMDIGKVEKRLRALTPNSRIVVAHGQMDTRTLAEKMRDFERGEYDVLLSTTIIESGIDIPRANTILVDQADMFGMADLYQLRGRVGRSARQGYAYFLLPASGIIDSDARERLAALQRHGGLGGGFNLAVRDLELRGAGNLLGSQQSGHIAAVGFGLYCQLLKRTIALLKGEKVREVVDVKLNLDFATPRLPYDYIEEDVQRLSLMKRFAEAQDVKIVKALAAEMKDRFGPLPPEAKEFVRISELRVRCAACGVEHVDTKETRAVFYKAGSREIFKVIDLKGKTADRKLTELLAAVHAAQFPSTISETVGRKPFLETASSSSTALSASYHQ